MLTSSEYCTKKHADKLEEIPYFWHLKEKFKHCNPVIEKKFDQKGENCGSKELHKWLQNMINQIIRNERTSIIFCVRCY